MKTLQEKINEWKERNAFNYSHESESEFFEWLQGDEYPGAEVEDNGISGTDPAKRWYTLKPEDGTEEDFYL